MKGPDGTVYLCERCSADVDLWEVVYATPYEVWAARLCPSCAKALAETVAGEGLRLRAAEGLQLA